MLWGEPGVEPGRRLFFAGRGERAVFGGARGWWVGRVGVIGDDGWADGFLTWSGLGCDFLKWNRGGTEGWNSGRILLSSKPRRSLLLAVGWECRSDLGFSVARSIVPGNEPWGARGAAVFLRLSLGRRVVGASCWVKMSVRGWPDVLLQAGAKTPMGSKAFILSGGAHPREAILPSH